MFWLKEQPVRTRGVSSQERRLRSEASLRRWTNFALLVAVAIGLGVADAHGGTVSASFMAYGAAIGMGAVLGFLFGVPGFSRRSADARTTPASHSEIVAGSSVTEESASHARGIGTIGDHSDSTPTATAVTGGSSEAVEASPAPTSIAAATITPASDPGVTTGVSQGPPSNLEQVADWVTKLLLGGGLTQMQHIPPLVWRWSRWVALGILGEEAKQPGKVTEQAIVAHQAFAAGLLDYGFVLGFFGGFLITKLQLGRAISSN